MARISLAGFKDPVRRPRFIIWTGVIVLVLAAVVVLALGVVSSRWFCAMACHKVQDDSIIAYSHSSHSKVSCLACHVPVNADPITFMICKVKDGLGLIPTVLNTYELPLNAEDRLALSKADMPERTCTQCHDLSTRPITPSPGIIINHDVHSKAGYQCTICHNRIAHREDFALTIPGNRKHEDFMTMDACFRCHSLQPGAKAPGQCTACHPKDFSLKPAFHMAPDFYPSGHATLAKADYQKVSEALAAEAKGTTGEKAAVPALATVSNCETCHVKKDFCDKCHGMTMPHPESFKYPTDPKAVDGHPAMSQAKATSGKCEFCHQQSKTHFCDNCHHGDNAGGSVKGEVPWSFNVKVPWQTQHASAVASLGVEGCLGKCHASAFCRSCHNRLKPLPSSHRQAAWLHNKVTVSIDGQQNSAKATALHVAAFEKSQSDCAVCHGDGGTKAAFCKGCHRLDMPHTDNFKQFHSGTGKKNPTLCQNCHRFKQICSNCHHVGASDSNPWLGRHGAEVTKVGNADTCFEKCHKRDFCNACHTRLKPIPASHRAKNWLHGSGSNRAQHTKNFTAAPDTCTYCHGSKGVQSAFCMGCHKIVMPHPDTFGPKVGEAPTKDNGGDHAALFKKGQLSRALCNNCHNVVFCDTCHHKAGYVPGKGPWGVANVRAKQQHPAVVKAKGATPCYDCHLEAYCSHCHVTSSR
jgi:hypothetical protein